jgi:hypothetical protein
MGSGMALGAFSAALAGNSGIGIAALVSAADVTASGGGVISMT